MLVFWFWSLSVHRSLCLCAQLCSAKSFDATAKCVAATRETRAITSEVHMSVVKSGPRNLGLTPVFRRPWYYYSWNTSWHMLVQISGATRTKCDLREWLRLRPAVGQGLGHANGFPKWWSLTSSVSLLGTTCGTWAPCSVKNIQVGWYGLKKKKHSEMDIFSISNYGLLLDLAQALTAASAHVHGTYPWSCWWR